MFAAFSMKVYFYGTVFCVHAMPYAHMAMPSIAKMIAMKSLALLPMLLAKLAVKGMVIFTSEKAAKVAARK